MKRQGSGLNRIKSVYESTVIYAPNMETIFYLDKVQYTVTLKHLNDNANKEKKTENYIYYT